jgi:hypothetical protein
MIYKDHFVFIFIFNIFVSICLFIAQNIMQMIFIRFKDIENPMYLFKISIKLMYQYLA